ncbi:MAG: histidine triad nucleotide-binding protein [Clostridiaceae bacterium]|jgi:histidine triad (HIT) family protein|nr:histidine triad nucleotide-binding protein [Clostridiaceae bacterium]
MMDCLFCKIAAGEIPSKKIYEDEIVYAFYDIQPAAPTHFLVIPKAHTMENCAQINEENAQIMGHIFQVIARLARQLGLEENGYRVVTNCGEDAGQTVRHLHFHVLGGGPLGKMA